MINDTQLWIGESHTARVGRAMLDPATWECGYDGTVPALTIAERLGDVLRTMDAILVVGPTRTSGTWVENFHDVAYLTQDTTSPWFRDAFRSVVVDEVHEHTHLLLVRGLEPVDHTLSLHTSTEHGASAVVNAAASGGDVRRSTCDVLRRQLVALGVLAR